MRYNKRYRRFLLWLSHHVAEDAILDYLYPDNCVVTFKTEAHK